MTCKNCASSRREAEKSHFQCIYYYLIFRCSFAAVATCCCSVFYFSIYSTHFFSVLFLSLSLPVCSFSFRVRVIVETRNRLQSFLPASFLLARTLCALFNFVSIILERWDLTSFARTKWYSLLCVPVSMRSRVFDSLLLPHASNKVQYKCAQCTLPLRPSLLLHHFVVRYNALNFIEFSARMLFRWLMSSYCCNFVEQRDNTSVIDGDAVVFAAVTIYLIRAPTW